MANEDCTKAPMKSDTEVTPYNNGSPEDLPPDYHTVINVPIDAAGQKKIEEERETLLADIDPWDIVEIEDDQAPWSELTLVEKFLRVFFIFMRLVVVLGTLYIFICSLDILGASFQLLGGRAAGGAFSDNELLSNPIAGIMIGVLATVLLQSSSTSTSITVTMVSSGLLNVRTAIPIIMGANIGTSVTNTIVSMTQSGNRNQFRRAFGGATVHDMFNWLSVIIFLPLEVLTGYLYHLTKAIVSTISADENSDNPQFLKVLTKPLTDLIVQVDKKVIEYIAKNVTEQKRPLLKYWCKEDIFSFSEVFSPIGNVNKTFTDVIDKSLWTKDVKMTNDNETNSTILSWKDVNQENSKTCVYAFAGHGLPDSVLSETAVGFILLLSSLSILVICLFVMVKTLHSLLKGPMANIIKKTINSELPGHFGFLTGYVAILVGAGVTVLVQSSSVFTSTLTPLVGMGVVTLERVYPLTLGSNIGTTITGILAALTSSPDKIQDSLQISFCHLFFNISGILVFYPIPFMRNIPIYLAKKLGNTTAEYRWFAVLYLIFLFFLLPGLVFLLSLAGGWVLLGVGLPLVLLFVIIVIINILQNKCSNHLPDKLKTWEFLPLWMHSLQPYDKICHCCCKKTKENAKSTNGPIAMDRQPTSDPVPDSPYQTENGAHGNQGFVSETERL